MLEHLVLHELIFKKPAGTSRGVLHTKPSWIFSYVLPNGALVQTEFPIIPGLSPEYIDHQQYESKLLVFLEEVRPFLLAWSETDFFTNVSFGESMVKWNAFPSFIFGLEVLLLAIKAKGSNILFDTAFTRQETTIPINGLVWMGTLADMRTQAIEKIASGFQTVKLKIGSLDWPQELWLLQELRAHASVDKLTIRVDANGAFAPSVIGGVLEELARIATHSIEQPISAGQVDEMTHLCAHTPVPIALDEELIGVNELAQKCTLLDAIRPQYIILKPSLHGGLSGVREWIQLAEERGIGWWLTSALESSIGLSAIVQFGACYAPTIPQGFGTGGLYTNNFPSPLLIQEGHICWVNDLHKG
jgi:L-alanine-DL-glutamate epimerase-like enolase superfamily enzyme